MVQVFSDAIVALINPPDLLSGMPGEPLLLSVVIQNQGSQGAVVDVFLDDADDIPKRWCQSPRQRLALDAAQSDEVVFEFRIPIDAEPGTYDYSLIVDAPEHYPEDTPIQFPQRLRVQIKDQTVLKIGDPSFFFTPTTNSQKPARLKQGEPLNLQVRVENRSNLVDRFRLLCLDLEEEWYTIRYPSQSLQNFGILSEPTALELNPNTTGVIQVELHPPSSAFAGIYSPTFRLYSDNQPDLVSLDLVYLDVQPATTLNVSLETIVGKVSQNPGQYWLKVQNPGNLTRQLTMSASSRDEEELCRYDYDPVQVRLLPNRDAQVMLHVTPIHRWRQPWVGMGQTIYFQVRMHDAQGYPIPDRLPEGTLVWKARPWWQLLLVLLLGLGAIGTLAALIWFLFLRPPARLEIAEFRAEKAVYTEGDDVLLHWTVKNAKRLEQLDLSAVSAAVPFSKSFRFNGQIPDELQNRCEYQKQDLVCSRFLTDAKKADTYKFELRATAQNQQTSTTTEVKIDPKPDPKVLGISSDRAEYKAGETVLLNWKLNNVDQLSTLTVLAKDQEGKIAKQQLIFDRGIIKDFQSVCKTQPTTLTCAKVPIVLAKSGKYTFELQGTTQRDTAIASSPSSPINVAARPIRIVSFTLNGQEAPAVIPLKVGQPFVLNWQVQGGEGKVRVQVGNYGSDFPASGNHSDPGFPTAGEQSISIAAIDEKGQQQPGSNFVVRVIAPPPPPNPSPTPVKPAASPIPAPSARF
ncbi:hypothetical protein H6F89_28275 [Cyanobacteria bacterium FACHB-63]|nr:hypothetical protein [Cyanobacteria bacterium FACHB-63]